MGGKELLVECVIEKNLPTLGTSHQPSSDAGESTLKLTMSMTLMELIARRFRALGEPLRLRILQALEAGEKTVSELVAYLDGNHSNVSKHLKILHETGLVSRRRSGLTVSYAISDPTVFQLCTLVRSSEACKRTRELEALVANPQQR